VGHILQEYVTIVVVFNPKTIREVKRISEQSAKDNIET
jgi:hypothetical protein